MQEDIFSNIGINKGLGADSSRGYLIFVIIFVFLFAILLGLFLYFFVFDRSDEEPVLRPKEIENVAEDVVVEADFSPQDIQGSIQGVFIADILTKPFNQHITGMEKGFYTASSLAEEGVEIESPYFAAILVLDEIRNALEVDVQNEVKKSKNRGEMLEKHLFLLENLEKSGLKTYSNIQSHRQSVDSDWGASSEITDDLQGDFFDQLDNLNAVDTEKLFNKFVVAKQEEAEQRAELGLLMALEKKFQFYIPQLQNKIATIKKNREAIILGITVK